MSRSHLTTLFKGVGVGYLPHESKSQSNLLPETQQDSAMASPVRCRPLPYTTSKEQRSTETLQSMIVASTECLPVIQNSHDELSISRETHLDDVPVSSSSRENDLHEARSLTLWLNSLLAKISDNSSTISRADESRLP